MMNLRKVLFWLLALTALGGCNAPEPQRSNLLLITVDTLRPDALGLVSGGKHTPHIDRLGAEGMVFTGAVSHVPLTLPSHTSMMTGLFPLHHGVHDNGQIVGEPLRTLAEHLQTQGYHTAAFVSGFPLRRSFGLDAGFAEYNDVLPEGAEGWVERRAMDTTEAVLAHVRKLPEPWFIWVHYYDPHDPYDPPEGYRQPGPRGAYDGEVAYVDAAIGRLRDGLKASAARTLTIFTADHGEGLGEHHESGHGMFIYDSTMLVPLIVHAPGRVSPGRSAAPLRLVDLAPTALRLLGQPALPDIDGVDAGALLAGKPFEVPAAYQESQQAWISYGWAPLTALRETAWKYIQAPRPELYALDRDSAEQHNLAETEAVRMDDLSARLDALSAGAKAGATAVDDPQLLEQLRSLGYIGAGRSASEVPPDAADPKDRIAERDLLLQAEALHRAGRFDEAVAAFDQVLARDPGNRFATLRAGIALLKQGRLEDAVPRLQAAVKLDPEQAETRFALADALSRSGQIKPAIEQWLETVRLQPRRSGAWANLGSMFAQDQQLPRAQDALTRAFELDPGNHDILANLQALEQVLKTPGSTLSLLRAQAKAQPETFAHPGTLGLLLLESSPTEAADWLRKARTDETRFAEARWQLCLIEAYGGRLDAARSALKEAIAADPRYAEAARGLAVTKTLLPQ